MTAALSPFDREVAIGELFTAEVSRTLATALTAVLPGGFRLLDADGRVLAQQGNPTSPTRAPIRLDIDIAGYLEGTEHESERLAGAARLVQLIAHQSRRYQMAADLHLEAVHEDYRALQEKHQHLEESEARYRTLAESLEVKVAEQVHELDTNRRQLYEAEKMASVGQLAAGMAHEINNPIGFIRSNLSAAKSYVQQIAGLSKAAAAGDGDAMRRYWDDERLGDLLDDFAALVAESVSGADRVARIVADLKEFANIDRIGQQEIDVNEQVRAVCQIAAAQVNRTATVELALGAVPRVACDAGRINQVLLNLLLNAAQAVTPPGQIRLATAYSAGEVRISVADNGGGIAPEVLPRIFDPFFTTRDVGAGTGLGLTVARDVVQAHGGRIEVESQVGQGATFTVVLPVQSAGALKRTIA
jgi:two-component system NtrC family sensor kinase